MKWYQQIAKLLNSKHSDTIAVIRAGKRKAKHRTVKRNRMTIKRDLRL